jgi:hypothetical protein
LFLFEYCFEVPTHTLYAANTNWQWLPKLSKESAAKPVQFGPTDHRTVAQLKGIIIFLTDSWKNAIFLSLSFPLVF